MIMMIHCGQVVNEALTDTQPNRVLCVGPDHVAGAVRGLSMLQSALQRCVLYLALLRGALTHHEQTRGLLTRAAQAAQTPAAEVLLQYTQLALESLGRLLQGNRDDAVMVVHMALDQLGAAAGGAGAAAAAAANGNYGVWATVEARGAWERDFTARCCPAGLQRPEALGAWLAEQRGTIAADSAQSQEVLGHVHELVELGQVADFFLTDRGLWRFRAHVSVQHFFEQLRKHQAAVAATPDEASRLFLLEELHKRCDMMQALADLPRLLETHQRLAALLQSPRGHDAAQWTLRELVHSDLLLGDADRELLEAAPRLFNRVLDLMRADCEAFLPAKARLTPRQLEHRFALESQVADFLPDLLHPTGKVSFALALCLCVYNNSVLDRVKTVLGPGYVHAGLLPVRHLQGPNTVAVSPRDLHKILWQHVEQPLDYGRGTDTVYDFAEIQRVLLDNFVRQARFIDIDNLLASCSSRLIAFEVCNAGLLRAVQERFAQKDLEPEVLARIALALHGSHQLSAAADLLETALSFLAMAGSEPGMLLKDFLARMLQVGNDQHCLATVPEANSITLQHIVSLWSKQNKKKKEE